MRRDGVQRKSRVGLQLRVVYLIDLLKGILSVLRDLVQVRAGAQCRSVTESPTFD